MLKKIPTREVRLGMFLQSLEGSWLAHPFWKTRFLLQDPADLSALHKSGVPAVWIDVEKGADVAGAALAPQAAVAAVPSAPADPAESLAVAEDAPLTRVELLSELDRAAQVVKRSRQKIVLLFNEVRLGRAADVEQCLPVVQDVADSVSRNPQALISLARLKTRDDYTYMHSVAVCALMVSLARQLGMDEARTREAGLAGLLHDVGKMLVPADVLNKPGRLSDDEFDIIKLHPTRGFELLKSGGAAPDSSLDVCLHHHERMDGTGYPAKLQGEQISMLARMGAVCDVYDAITSERVYKAAWDPAVSLSRMAQWQGHFDPVVFQAFVKSLGIYPVGSLVRLESQRLAVVVEQGEGMLLTPRVKAFYSLRGQTRVQPRLINLADGTDRIVARESPSDWSFPDLAELWLQGV
ncbi:HD-GYP domain-containing protein [Burkholderiaceae bacterium UC74_6]